MQPSRLPAYQEYVIAQDLYWRGAFGPAFVHFRRATELDPAFDSRCAGDQRRFTGAGPWCFCVCAAQ